MKNFSTVFFLLHVSKGSGIISHCIDLATALEKYSYQVVFIYGDNEASGFTNYGQNWIAEKGFKIHNIDFRKKGGFRSLFLNLRSIWRFIRLLFEYKPVLIHSHFRSMTLFAMIGKLLMQSQTVFTVHLQNMPRNRLSNFFIKQYDAYIAISQHLKKELIEQGIPEEKMDLIYNGVDDRKFYPRIDLVKQKLRIKLKLQPDKFTILSVARLQRVKSLHTLIKAIATLPPNIRVQTQCVILGEGSRRNKLMALTRKLRVEETVQFVGFTAPHEYYGLSDVFVLPSLMEGFSVAVVEAMQCGLPILMTPTSGSEEQVLPGHNGFIFPFNDFRKLANYLQLLFNNPELLLEMQTKSRELAKKRFTAEMMVEQTQDVYNQLLLSNNIITTEMVETKKAS